MPWRAIGGVPLGLPYAQKKTPLWGLVVMVQKTRQSRGRQLRENGAEGVCGVAVSAVPVGDVDEELGEFSFEGREVKVSGGGGGGGHAVAPW